MNASASLESLPESLQAAFQELPNLHITETSPRRLKINLQADALPAFLELLKGRAGYIHLSAISCVDWDESNEFELVYHLWSYQVKTLVSAHILIPKKPGRYVSVHDIHTPAAFFERDIHEMFGLYFEGAPDQEPFILTEWYGPPPMLKSFDTEAYANDTWNWQDYQPKWLQEIEANGGGLVGQKEK
ncbi:NADH-quinone oxidoreductase subunit C [Candidatus Venteria ishoeyi]|uniref:NADH-quinone oxidoreductase subunit C n=1 Tax=Candidatus Venteria ishoeyi TaxID=1899563 RepID=A0A1H6FA56_9GAMM|nr:NADH-quinone oxidoreductase subunit C [Candidatus Venteria ishoeyi]SEH06036.1 NADH-quinone oxidoreductase subunit C [Candidatus Venteria ishoeyi]